jgi:hypothetical protein
MPTIPELPDLNTTLATSLLGNTGIGTAPLPKPASLGDLLAWAALPGVASDGFFPATRRCRAHRYFESATRELAEATMPALSASHPAEADIDGASRPERRALLDSASDVLVEDAAILARVRLAARNLHTLQESCAAAAPVLVLLLQKASSAQPVSSLEELGAWHASLLGSPGPEALTPVPDPFGDQPFLHPKWTEYEAAFQRAGNIIVRFDFRVTNWRPFTQIDEHRNHLLQLCRTPHGNLPPLEIARRYFDRLREDSTPKAIEKLQALTQAFADEIRPHMTAFDETTLEYTLRLRGSANLLMTALEREGQELRAEREHIVGRRQELELRRAEIEAMEIVSNAAALKAAEASAKVKSASALADESQQAMMTTGAARAASEARLTELRRELLAGAFQCPHGDPDVALCTHPDVVARYLDLSERKQIELDATLARHAVLNTELRNCTASDRHTRRALLAAKQDYIPAATRQVTLALEVAAARAAHSSELLSLQDLDELNARDQAAWARDNRSVLEVISALSEQA